MKRSFKSVMFIAAAALAFAGCQPNEIEKIEQTGNGTHTVTFTAELGNTTKTTMSEGTEAATFSWTSEDGNHFVAYENGVAAEAIGVLEGDIMKVTAEFNDGANSPYTYTAILNGSMPSQQVLYDGKYDETSDVLVAKPVESADILDEFTFQFKRVVALNKMTIKGLGTDEIVSKVVISSDKAIAGDYDIENDCWVEYVNGAPSNEITLDGGKDEGVLIDGGNAVVYFNCVPVEGAQLTIDVTTDKATYSKTFSKTISLLEGQLNKFGVTVSVPAEPAYVKVTSEPSDWSGQYLLVYEGEDVNYCWTGVDAGKCHVDATISNNIIATVPSGAVTLTISPMEGGYSIRVNGGINDGKYIGQSSYSNGLSFTEAAQLNTIEIGEESAVISGVGKSVQTHVTMRYNKSTGDNNERFRYYKSGQEPVQLYKYNGTIEVVSVTGVSLSQSELALEVGESETLVSTVLPENADNKSVTWSSSNEAVATVKDGVVTAVGVGEATITVTTVDGEFNAICDVTVNAATVEVYNSLADLIAAGEPTEAGTPVTVTLTDVVIESIFVTSQGYRNGVFLKVPETDKKIEIYSHDVPAKWEAFGKISGTLENCTWKKFNNTTWELCPEDWDDLDYTAPVKYNVVLLTGLVGGTVSADIIEAAAGATVTLTATPSTGYQFASWSVKDASENDLTVTDNAFTMPASDVTVSAIFEQSEGGQGGTEKTFTITSADVVTNSNYKTYETTVDKRDWIITFGGNNKSVGTNSGNRSKCKLSSDSKYTVAGVVTTSDIASAFACKSLLSNVKKISYTFNGGSNQTDTNVYVIYSADGNTFSQISLTSGTQGEKISSGTTYEFTPCNGYFALLFKATNSSGNWRIDDVNITFTYAE